MHRTHQLDGHDVLPEDGESAEDSRYQRRMNLTPFESAMSELAEGVADDENEKLKLEGHADVTDSENSISEEEEKVQKLVKEFEEKVVSEDNADAAVCADPGKLIPKVDKASDPDVEELTPEELEKVIAKRKAERKRKAEAKRQEGLRRIAEMNSRDGLDPQEDLFPEEIWIKILKDWDPTPQDRYNMCLVHPFFDTLMKDTKIQDVLLPLVMDYKIPFLESFQFDNKLGREQFKAFRQVSTSVRDAVDKWIEDDLLYSMRNSVLKPRVPPVSFDFWDENVADLAERIAVYTNSAPIAERPMRFFMRSLHINYILTHWGTRTEMIDDDVGEELEEYQSLFTKVFNYFNDIITEFLEKVGDQILYLHLVIGHSSDVACLLGVQIHHICSSLRKWLLLLPNLKWLKLEVFAEDERWKWTPVRYEDEPMPRLNALERMDLRWDREHVPSIMRSVIAANPHVKHVGLESSGLSEVYPAISAYALDSVDINYFGRRNLYWKQELPQQISDSDWKLKKISLVLEHTSLNVVFKSLQENLPTLEDVALHLSWKTKIGKELNFLRLPNLKYFKLDFGMGYDHTGEGHFFFDLHFLLYCNKLESLTWKNTLAENMSQRIRKVMGRSQNRRLINFPGEGGADWNLSMSKVWKVFPDLKVVKIWHRGRGVHDGIPFMWSYQYRP